MSMLYPSLNFDWSFILKGMTPNDFCAVILSTLNCSQISTPISDCPAFIENDTCTSSIGGRHVIPKKIK